MNLPVVRPDGAWHGLVCQLAQPRMLVFGANLLRAGCAFIVTLLAARKAQTP